MKHAGGAVVGKHAIWPPLPKESHPKEVLGSKEAKREEKKEEKQEEKKEAKKEEERKEAKKEEERKEERKEKEQKKEVTAAAAGKKDVMESKDEKKTVPGLTGGGSGVQVGVASRSSSFVANAIAAVNDHKSFEDKDGGDVDKNRERGREEKEKHFKWEEEKQPLPLPISPSKKTLATDDNIPTADEPTSEPVSSTTGVCLSN